MKTICPTCRKDNRHRDTLSHFLLKHRPKCQGVCADDSFAMARHAVTLWYYDQRERAGALSRARAERDKGGGGVSDGAVSHAAGGVSSVTILSYHIMSCHVMSCHVMTKSAQIRCRLHGLLGKISLLLCGCSRSRCCTRSGRRRSCWSAS